MQSFFSFSACDSCFPCLRLVPGPGLLSPLAGAGGPAATGAPEDSGAPRVRLFILSGQSNMVNLDPEDTFLPALRCAFPNERIAIVKDAESGQPLRRWFEHEQPRDLYQRLWSKVEAAMPVPRPASIAFLWMQGEADASWAEDSGRYRQHFHGLVKQLRKDLKHGELVVVVGRISDHFRGTEHGDAVRGVQVRLAGDDPRIGWIDTDDVPRRPDGIHYNREGLALLGKRFAEKAIEGLTSLDR